MAAKYWTFDELLNLMADNMNFGRRFSLGRGIVAIGLVGFIAWRLLTDDAGQTETITMGIVSVVIAIYGLSEVRAFFTQRGEASLICTTLRTYPERVVWIFPTPIFRSGVHVETEMTFAFDDGAAESVILPARTEYYLPVLLERCPTATYGYSAELAEKFRKSPESLRSAAS